MTATNRLHVPNATCLAPVIFFNKDDSSFELHRVAIEFMVTDSPGRFSV